MGLFRISEKAMNQILKDFESGRGSDISVGTLLDAAKISSSSGPQKTPRANDRVIQIRELFSLMAIDSAGTRIDLLQRVPDKMRFPLKLVSSVSKTNTGRNMDAEKAGKLPVEKDYTQRVSLYNVASSKLNDIRKSSAKVFCSCPDFTYTFANYLWQQGALEASKAPVIKRKAGSTRPARAADSPGICRHLYAVINSKVVPTIMSLNESYARSVLIRLNQLFENFSNCR